jgi:acyl CoA:acetate/3-ketoacid CoA transferase beta subunit
LCVLDVTATGFEVIELAHGVTREQLAQKTEVSMRFSDALLERA